MKKLMIVLAAFVLLLTATVAESKLDGLKREELLAMRDEHLAQLADINAQLGALAREERLAATEESVGKIKDLFPDPVVAKWVRDQLGKLSINQPVTQAELDQIRTFRIFSDYGTPADLTGIGYLRNLEEILIDHNNSSGFTGSEFPEDFYTLRKLKKVYAWECADWRKSNITSISPRIGEMTSLEYLGLGYAKITQLPDEICNLTNLETLSVGNTLLTALPENIGNLTRLNYLDISNTQITELPESLWNLDLGTIKMAGTPIE